MASQAPRPPRPQRCVLRKGSHRIPRPTSAPPAFRATRLGQGSAAAAAAAVSSTSGEPDSLWGDPLADANIQLQACRSDPLSEACIQAQEDSFDAEVVRVVEAPALSGPEQPMRDLHLPRRPSSARSADNSTSTVTPKRLAALQREVRQLNGSVEVAHVAAEPSTRRGEEQDSSVACFSVPICRPALSKEAVDGHSSSGAPAERAGSAPANAAEMPPRVPRSASPGVGVSRMRSMVTSARVDGTGDIASIPSTVTGSTAAMDGMATVIDQVNDLSARLLASNREEKRMAATIKLVSYGRSVCGSFARFRKVLIVCSCRTKPPKAPSPKMRFGESWSH
jgi:hypothetical protein